MQFHLEGMGSDSLSQEYQRGEEMMDGWRDRSADLLASGLLVLACPAVFSVCWDQCCPLWRQMLPNDVKKKRRTCWMRNERWSRETRGGGQRKAIIKPEGHNGVQTYGIPSVIWAATVCLVKVLKDCCLSSILVSDAHGPISGHVDECLLNDSGPFVRTAINEEHWRRWYFINVVLFSTNNIPFCPRSQVSVCEEGFRERWRHKKVEKQLDLHRISKLFTVVTHPLFQGALKGW